MCENDLPYEHPTVSSAWLVLGRSLLAEKLFAEAKPALENCLELRRKTLPEDHYLFATTNCFYGECLIMLGEVEKGSRLLRQSYEKLLEKLGETHEQTQVARKKLVRFRLNV